MQLHTNAVLAFPALYDTTRCTLFSRMWRHSTSCFPSRTARFLASLWRRFSARSRSCSSCSNSSVSLSPSSAELLVEPRPRSSRHGDGIHRHVNDRSWRPAPPASTGITRRLAGGHSEPLSGRGGRDNAAAYNRIYPIFFQMSR